VVVLINWWIRHEKLLRPVIYHPLRRVLGEGSGVKKVALNRRRWAEEEKRQGGRGRGRGQDGGGRRWEEGIFFLMVRSRLGIQLMWFRRASAGNRESQSDDGCFCHALRVPFLPFSCNPTYWKEIKHDISCFCFASNQSMKSYLAVSNGPRFLATYHVRKWSSYSLQRKWNSYIDKQWKKGPASGSWPEFRSDKDVA
jgi:hypothetical protein